MTQDTVISLVVIILGGMAGVALLLKRLKRRQSRRWPTAAGYVESTLLRMEERGEYAGKWVAHVRYAYEVLGQTHSGGFAREFFLKGRAEKWIAVYPTGRALTVRINPHKPADSLLLEAEQT